VTRRRDDDRPAAELDDVAVGQFLIDADGRDRCRRQLSLDPVEYGLFPGFQVGRRACIGAADEGRVGLVRVYLDRAQAAISAAEPTWSPWKCVSTRRRRLSGSCPIAWIARAMSGADPGTPVSMRVRPSESWQR
jgi:hypothetical protein